MVMHFYVYLTLSVIFLCSKSSSTACRREFTSVVHFSSDFFVAPFILLANKFPIKEDEIPMGPCDICKNSNHSEKGAESKTIYHTNNQTGITNLNLLIMRISLLACYCS